MRTAGRSLYVLALLLWAAAMLPAGEADGPAASRPADAKDAPRAVWTGVERIVAVGDVHGDYEQFVLALRAAGVIDKNADWSGGKTHLVQTGDVLDRSAESRKAMDLLMKLEVQAAKAGGAVHALIGNHEAMVMLSDYRYVHRGEVEAMGGEEAFIKAFAPKGQYGRWILGHNTVIRINDILFCHAGLTRAYARLTLEKINDSVRTELAGNARAGVAGDPDGPLWTREPAVGDEDDVAGQLDAVFKAFAARHMVIGHTVDRGGVSARAGGRLIRIDVGMSEYYGGPAACLVVEKGRFYEVRDGGKKTDLKIEPPTTAPATTPASRPAHEPVAPLREAA